MDKKFCANLKETRKSCGLTQKQVATALNVVESCYANWEQGRREPDLAHLIRIANILEVDMNTLFELESQ